MLKNLIILFGFSTFVTIVWIGTTIFHNSAQSQISESNQRKIEPINSNFDMDTFDQLDTRQEVVVNLSDQLDIITDEEATLSSEEEVVSEIEPANLNEISEIITE